METSPPPDREPLLSPVDRISEILFGLFMALTFTGAVSVAGAGQEEVRTLFITALGCNLAWGLVDAVMYMVRTVTDRGRALTLMHSVRGAAVPEAGRAVIEESLPRWAATLLSPVEIEAIRGRMIAQPAVPPRPRLMGKDVLAGLWIFVLVVLATFPVVLPFAFLHDVDMAKNLSRGLSLVMLFLAGMGLGRYAGYGGLKAGVMMVGIGAALVVAINALGG